MFTGIVQARGRVAEIRSQERGVRLTIDRAGWNPPGVEIAPGDSVCVSGVCLTVVSAAERLIAFDVIAETLAKTTLGGLSPGAAVNLESSLLPTSQLSGHFVQGHVEGVGVVSHVRADAEEYRLTIQPPRDLMPYLIPKGSVAVDGVSMTIAAVGADTFDMALIPTTLERTTLGLVQRGERVNIETDIISRTVVHQLRQMTAPAATVTLATLRAAGFVASEN